MCRSPCGERGLKLFDLVGYDVNETSLPVRGAWIEIQEPSGGHPEWHSRSPCGERGLKFENAEDAIRETSRSPCGERGLKWTSIYQENAPVAVAPRAGSVD